jgi:hypothetical protein
MHPFVVLERFFDRKNICIFPREKHLVSQILGCHCKQPVVKPETYSPITDFNRRAGDEYITVHIAARDRAALPWMIRPTKSSEPHLLSSSQFSARKYAWSHLWH